MNRLADEFLILVRTIHIGGIEEVDAQFESAVNGGDRLLVITSSVELRHPHAAESDGGDCEPGAA